MSRERGALAGQVAIVTGGTVGIGLATAIRLAGEGAHVVVVGRNRAHLDNALAGIEAQGGGAQSLGLALDVRNEADMQRLAEKTRERFGRIDILVTAAGILRAGDNGLQTVATMGADDWDEVLDTNLKGVFLANRAVLPAMIGQGGGNIINLSSTSGRTGLAFDAAYCASKFAVIGLSEALAEEVRGYGIRVQVVLPGAIATGMWHQNGPLPPPRDILPSERVADFIVYSLTMPMDMMLEAPVIEPLKRHERLGGER
jgi:NAD(P)-dependent dehydrogenase (short-subunit alcohol dehydrogenase family)